MWLFVLLVAVPILEIALFIEIGGFIGLWPTLAIVVLTAILGANLLRAQGRGALVDLQSSLGGQGDPAKALAHGALILVAGVLLLTPGFFTDGVGFALLVPRIRAAVIVWGASRMEGHVTHVHASRHEGRRGPPRGPAGGETIEGEFEEVELEDAPRESGERRSERPSGWKRPD